MSRWKKIGKIFEPQGRGDWMVTHAMVPTVYQVHGNSVRVYFSGRDQENRSQIGFFEFDVTNPFKILRISEKPVLHIGELGCFDDNGVTPSWIVAHQDKLYLYYIILE